MPSYLAPTIGAALASGFYAFVTVMPFAILQRYFLGHPVAIAATILFCFALAILAVKWWGIQKQWRQVDRLQDNRLKPPTPASSPSGDFHNRHDAGHVARQWIESLTALPSSVRRSWLVSRLLELLSRQSQRGTTKHLSDDLRELSSRDADEAHDSLALVRIIVWAIPMLGFLGTVIGITQTLGGLDFSDGNAAVDNLKSGLYVAFDTTALGLVLSVLAIFLQFPVEKSEQRLLSEIDRRVGQLVSTVLPSDEAADNQYELVAQLCEGVRTAVAESLANQAQLWRGTIDEAQGYWQKAHETQVGSIVGAIETSLKPALERHARQIDDSAARNQERLHEHWLNWHEGINQWHESVAAWQESMSNGSLSLSQHHEKLIQQCEQLSEADSRTESVLQLQTALDANLERLRETNQQIDKNLGAAAGQGMADAMLVLARAVDVLTQHLPKKAAPGEKPAEKSGEKPAEKSGEKPGEASSSTRKAA